MGSLTEVIICEPAGFCYGVRSAVEAALGAASLAADGGRVYTYGDIVHNEAVLEELRGHGVMGAASAEGLAEGDTMIIRAHGIGPDERSRLAEGPFRLIDATCPHVRRIHVIAEEQSAAGRRVVIAGDASHAEVRGIGGHCGGRAIVVDGPEEAERMGFIGGEGALVAQTTMDKERYAQICDAMENKFDKAVIFDTICDATSLRLSRARELAKTCGCMVVVGGRDSSNTRKLFGACSAHCPATFHVGGTAELRGVFRGMAGAVRGYGRIGIAAGTSTPMSELVEMARFIKVFSNE